MMIKELDKKIIEKIAAGEVVERPANVVKELLENAIDANATSIHIELEQAGKKKIAVYDNGSGMSKEDAVIAIKPHTTSKISSLEDLESIATLGFRGEALASMCAVSTVTLITNKDEPIKVTVKDGVVTVSPSARSIGTTIIVENLFEFLPARQKFLKTDQTELQVILAIVNRYCLLYPHVSFKVTHNNKIIIQSPAVSSSKEKIGHIYGLELAKHVLPIQSSIVFGYVSLPTHTRSDKQGIILFLNGRHVRSETITQSVIRAYGTLLMVGRYPYAFLHIHLDPKTVDVNVHPSKEIVKFENEDEICAQIEKEISVIGQTQLIKNVEAEQIKIQTYEREVHPKELQDGSVSYDGPIMHSQSTTFLSETHSSIQDNSKLSQPDLNPKIKTKSEENTLPSHSPSSQEVFSKTPSRIGNDTIQLEYVGVIQKTYIVANAKDGLVLIDFHAAHERYLYEQFKKQFDHAKVQTQATLSPIIISLPVDQMQYILEQKDLFASCGIDVDQLGPNEIAVRNIPLLVFKQLDVSILKDILSGTQGITTIEKKIDHIFATMGCKAAYKAGDDISSELAKKIVGWLFKSDQKFACPHGRPIFIKISSYELEKLFKRKV